MIFSGETTFRQDMQAIYRRWIVDEQATVSQLVDQLPLDEAARQRVTAEAADLVRAERAWQDKHGFGIESLLHEYSLSSEEGVLLMCLAEALLRIPDTTTAQRLIADKIDAGDWQKHLGHGDSILVNATTWGIMLTGRLLDLGVFRSDDTSSMITRLTDRLTEPVLRGAISQAMHLLGRHFVFADNLDEAMQRVQAEPDTVYRYSFDMLGEAAVTRQDADRFFRAYLNAIKAIGPQNGELADNHGISVKLSALHPRYQHSQHDRVLDELVPRLYELCELARLHHTPVTIDAEESHRLELSLEILEGVSQQLPAWDGLGIAVQSYMKSAPAVIDWLAELSARHGRRFMLRLVKGAYWDGEVKQAQVLGLENYPVFTRKPHTDICYLACAAQLLARPDCFYPQFATHNAHTLVSVLEMAGSQRGFEFQLLHGMGEPLYHQVAGDPVLNVPCRVYAPVGQHRELLSYLVRRLIENGANGSFVNRIQDRELAAEEVVSDPIAQTRETGFTSNPSIPLPPRLYPDRKNSTGINLADPSSLHSLDEALSDYRDHQWQACAPDEGHPATDDSGQPVFNPANLDDQVGSCHYANRQQIDRAVTTAHTAHVDWCATAPGARAEMLEKMADLIERHRAELMTLMIRETGKTIADAVAEVREAVDFCRYYALQCRRLFSPMPLPGPTGEDNTLSLKGRGVFVCISPWNFPLSIFCGQVAAALAAGNCVLAKPAEQSCLTGYRATQLFHEAGIPEQVLMCLPGDGTTGAMLVEAHGIAGVAFTGSEDVAHAIHEVLATKPGPIVPLIAETGGVNCMIVDSSALAEQVVEDVLTSAFNSAGQRCSALRVLFLQTDIADDIENQLLAALDERVIGDPMQLKTDIGPLIDKDALDTAQAHIRHMQQEAHLVHMAALPGELMDKGHFAAPSIFAIEHLEQLQQEVFGPVLHIIRFRQNELDDIIDQINASGFGLTLALHSRLDSTIEKVSQRARIGNIYVNRNQIGAVVGVQPFGGEGRSGTGPKAGGPYTLLRFATERTVTVNTTAQGGNAELLRTTDSPG